jgi:hypothetical protein
MGIFKQNRVFRGKSDEQQNSINLVWTIRKNQVGVVVTVVPDSWKDEAGRSLELGNSSSAWETQQDTISKKNPGPLPNFCC